MLLVLNASISCSLGQRACPRIHVVEFLKSHSATTTFGVSALERNRWCVALLISIIDSIIHLSNHALVLFVLSQCVNTDDLLSWKYILILELTKIIFMNGGDLSKVNRHISVVI